MPYVPIEMLEPINWIFPEDVPMGKLCGVLNGKMGRPYLKAGISTKNIEACQVLIAEHVGRLASTIQDYQALSSWVPRFKYISTRVVQKGPTRNRKMALGYPTKLDWTISMNHANSSATNQLGP